MSAGRILTAAVAGLAVVFTAAFGVGRMVAPTEADPPVGTIPASAPHSPGHDLGDATTHSG